MRITGTSAMWKGRRITLASLGFGGGSYYVRLDGELIGRVVRVCETSGSATRWKATGEFVLGCNYGTRGDAVEALVEDELRRSR